MKKLIIIFAAVVLFGTGFAKADTWATVDYPGASQTRIRDIDGGNLVGYYNDNAGLSHGFLRSGTTWATLDAPGASFTYAYGIDGDNIVGYYEDASFQEHGFLYNITAQSWTNIPVEALGIDGDNIVGGNKIYNMATQTTTTLNMPGRDETEVYGIDGSNIVGYSSTKPTDLGQQSSGFLYDGTMWTSLAVPGTPAGQKTFATDIDGGNIVGFYSVAYSHGFLYNGTKWTILDAPGATYTRVWGIDGDLLVGSYRDSSGEEHGFVYEVPEPATALLLITGAAFFGLSAKQR